MYIPLGSIWLECRRVDQPQRFMCKIQSHKIIFWIQENEAVFATVFKNWKIQAAVKWKPLFSDFENKAYLTANLQWETLY